MAEIRATPQQQAAASYRGGALLVSAAAGSGKTKVLIDRLMGYLTDPDHPADIDEFLMITYTKAAASELRGKIAARIAEQLAEEPDNRHLQRQMTRVYLAQISTVHAFCQTILRQYAVEAELPADFRVADEQQAAALRAQVLRDTLAERYADVQQEPDFAAMIDTLGYGRDDRRLLALAEESYTIMRCQVDPAAWMQSCLQAYDLPEGTQAEETIWGSYFMQERLRVLQSAQALLEQALTLCAGDEKMETKCRPVLQKNLEDVQTQQAMQTWDACVTGKLTSFGTMRGAGDPDTLARIKALRKQAWDSVKDIQSCFYADSARVVQDLRRTLPALRGLLSLLRDFDARFTQEKLRRHLLDFSDLEHRMIRLLTQRGSGKPTAAARSISETYREILIDEYQDSNAVQECIFQAVSRDGANLFMVGDVKQSIYRFRLADPAIFLRKYNTYPMLQSVSDTGPRKLLLSQNFRSRAEVLSAANDVFSLVMKKEAGELDYTEDEALVPGLPYPQADGPKVELHCLNLTDSGENGGGKTEAEAEFVASRIAKLLDDSTMVTANGALRSAKASDIVILMRSPGMSAGVYQAALQRRGIACETGNGTDLLQTAEVEILLQLLQLIDNPHCDIPLIAAMASPVFGFSPEELALLRAQDQASDFYGCICACEQPTQKLRAFTDWLHAMRRESRRAALPELLNTIVQSSGLETVFSAMEDGARRSRNIAAFSAFVTASAQTDVHSLSELVRLLDELIARGAQLPAQEMAAQTNAVRIMSIHKSKGLEFPIVILADLSRKMNLQDNQSAVLTDDALLLGGNVVNLQSRSFYPSLARMAIMRRKTQQTVSEEMRVLYVAMTRAKERLIMTSCAARYDKRLQNLVPLLSVPLLSCVSASARRPDDWILMTALCRTESGELFARSEPCACSSVQENPWRVTMQDVEAPQAAVRGQEQPQRVEAAPFDMQQALACIEFQYAHEAATKLPSKLTATQLKGRLLDEEAAEEAPQARTNRPHRTLRLRQDAPLTGRERGNATHLFMQFVRYAACTTEEGIRQELERLQTQKFLTPAQAGAVDVGKILQLFTSALGTRILTAQKLRREFKFSILTGAAEFDPAAAGEQVMLQGVVDCFWQEPDGIVILDFKTDYIDGDLTKKAECYAPQLHAYAGALSRIYEMPVKQTILYFFSAGEAVEV